MYLYSTVKGTAQKQPKRDKTKEEIKICNKKRMDHVVLSLLLSFAFACMRADRVALPCPPVNLLASPASS